MTSLYEQYRDTLRRAHVAALAGRHGEALDAYREAAGHIEGRAAPYVGIGRMELALDRPAAALVAFEAALAADPRSDEALAGRARAEAVLVPVPVFASDSALPRRIASKVPDDGAEIRDLVRRWDAALAAADVLELLDVVVGLARADRPGAAGAAIRDALSIAPHEPRIYRTAAWLERRGGRHGQAHQVAALLDRYLAIIDDPDALERAMASAETDEDLPALLDVAERHHLHGRPRSALEVAFAAMRLAPSDVEVHLTIARVHLGMGMRARAVRDLAQLARYLDVANDASGRDRLAAFVNRDLQRPQPGPEPA